MSAPPEHESKILDALVEEAKTDLHPTISEGRWSAMEDAIVARVDAEVDAEDARASRVHALSPSPAVSPSRGLKVGVLLLAAAAAVALVVHEDPNGGSTGRSTAALDTPSDALASSLRATEGPGQVRVGGVRAAAGHVLRAGDLLEAEGARAVLERPRRVVWLLEGRESIGATSAGNGRAHVKSAAESLVLGLEEGAIEAQVTPVPSGEAFAVDVAGPSSVVRIAVHGTHLRVARLGTRVTVDLTEGVVSIGAPPRVGTTYGTLVTAPAHVELDVTDLQGTLHVDHGPASVRAAIPLASDATAMVVAPARAPVVANAEKPSPVILDREPASPRPVPVPRPTSMDPEPPASKADTTKPALPPREAIAAAVRECAVARSSRARPGDVGVTVTSSLRLKIGSGGSVESAQFDPPLLPEIQTCAAAAIYKAKLNETGATVTIPIEFSY